MSTEVTIVGAGPYGLSLGAHLDALNIPHRIFGSPMEFWRRSMPEGMRLKSDGHASSLFDPKGEFPLSTYCQDHGIAYDDLGLPVAIETFISYGVEFQERFVPAVEDVRIVNIRSESDGFEVTLATGETFASQSVVLAVGIGYFAYLPPALADLPRDVVTHSSEHSDLSRFVDRDVAVIGAGASALDLAALLNRVGARPVLITRRRELEFHQRQRLPRPWKERITAPTSGIGPGWHSWVYCNFPGLFRRLPVEQRLKRTRSHLGPAGGWFIKAEVLGVVPVYYHSEASLTAEGDRVRVCIARNDGEVEELTVDTVIAATGYRVNMDRLDFLDPELRSRIKTEEGSPLLRAGFESSVPNLYFVGASAANAFGPVQRFAVGAGFAARRVSRRLASRRPRS